MGLDHKETVESRVMIVSFDEEWVSFNEEKSEFRWGKEWVSMKIGVSFDEEKSEWVCVFGGVKGDHKIQVVSSCWESVREHQMTQKIEEENESKTEA